MNLMNKKLRKWLKFDPLNNRQPAVVVDSKIPLFHLKIKLQFLYKKSGEVIKPGRYSNSIWRILNLNLRTMNLT